MNTTDPITAERARSDAWHAELDRIAKRLPLSPHDARALAFALLTEFLSHLVSADLGALYSTRMADVVLLVADLQHALYPAAGDVAYTLAPIRHAANRLHVRLFNAPGPRGTWPDELRIPSEAALAVRYACEADAIRVLPLLYTLARAALERLRMSTTELDRLLEEAERAAHADLVTGLDGLVQEAAAATKEDTVLHALHVACGAAAVDAVRRSGPEHPPTCCCPSCDEPDRLRDRPPPDMPITIPEERAWCERVSGRARAGAYASAPIVGVIDGKPVPVRGST